MSLIYAASVYIFLYYFALILFPASNDSKRASSAYFICTVYSNSITFYVKIQSNFNKKQEMGKRWIAYKSPCFKLCGRPCIWQIKSLILVFNHALCIILCRIIIWLLGTLYGICKVALYLIPSEVISMLNCHWLTGPHHLDKNWLPQTDRQTEMTKNIIPSCLRRGIIRPLRDSQQYVMSFCWVYGGYWLIGTAADD